MKSKNKFVSSPRERRVDEYDRPVTVGNKYYILKSEGKSPPRVKSNSSRSPRGRRNRSPGGGDPYSRPPAPQLIGG